MSAFEGHTCNGLVLMASNKIPETHIVDPLPTSKSWQPPDEMRELFGAGVPYDADGREIFARPTETQAVDSKGRIIFVDSGKAVTANGDTIICPNTPIY